MFIKLVKQIISKISEAEPLPNCGNSVQLGLLGRLLYEWIKS